MTDQAIEPLTYDRLHALGRRGFLRPLAGVVLLVLLGFAVAPALLSAALIPAYLVGGGDWSDRMQTALDTDHLTPVGLAVVNIGLALFVPSAMASLWLLHRLRPGWLASVAGRFRWRWFAASLGSSFVVLLVTVAVGQLLPGGANDGTDMSGHANAFTSTSLQFLIVILVLTPLQSAGEEYGFRGYLTQAFGGLFNRHWVAVVVPAVLFTLAHGQSWDISGNVFLGQPYPVLVDRFAFGLVAGILVIMTGGLEAGIAMHLLNNFVALGGAVLFGEITTALHPTGDSWWQLVPTLTQSLVYLWLALFMARRMGLRTTADPAVLVAS